MPLRFPWRKKKFLEMCFKAFCRRILEQKNTNGSTIHLNESTMGIQINPQEVLPLSWTTALPKVGVRVLMSAITVDWSCCIPSSMSGPTAEYSHQRPWQGQLPFSVVTPHSGPILSYPDFFCGVMTLLYSQTNFPFCFFGTNNKLISVFGCIIPFPRSILWE